MTRRSETDGDSKWPVAIFAAGLLMVAFGAGILARQFETFPIPLLRRAASAFEAVQVDESSSPFIDYSFPTDYDRAGVITHSPDLALQGYTFLTAYDGEKCNNILIDMEGRVLHEWYVPFSQAWEEAPFLLHQASDDWTCWHGAHLYDNGDLIINFAGTGFPDGWGTVKLDKNSDIIWKIARNTHHDVHVAENGTIYLPSLRYRQEPVSRLNSDIGPAEIARLEFEPPFEEDYVLVVSPEGEIIDEFSVLQALLASDYRGLVSVNLQKAVRGGVLPDPTHLNNIETITKEWAEDFGPAEEGDLLVSLRNLSTIALIDPASRVVKWAMSGQFVRQHDPDQVPGGTILVFDNWGAPAEYGRSQVLEIDPASQEVVWRYRGSAEQPFYTEIRGMQQLLDNGNVLITEPEGGRVFEVTRDADPRIVWEYRNKLLTTADGQHRSGIIVQAYRYPADALDFLN